MKLLVAFLVIFVVFVSVFAAPMDTEDAAPKPRKCVPGKSYYDGCNNCWCGSTGVTACTLKGCVTLLPNHTVINHRPSDPPEDFWQKDE